MSVAVEEKVSRSIHPIVLQVFYGLFLLLSVTTSPAQQQPTLIERGTASSFSPGFGEADLAFWQRHAPEVREITIRSSRDGTGQHALYYNSGTRAKKPLLIVLHGWSADYRQNIGVPYAEWAIKNDWVFIHPDHRGEYDHADAVASVLAQQDILDAVAYGKKNAKVDPSRIYLAGLSGGALTALIVGARYPSVWAGIVAWVPIFDLVDWWEYNHARFPKRDYASEIAAACGGEPRPGTSAEAECKRRSPSTYLRNARGKGVQFYLAAGIEDNIVEADHALRAFDLLADPSDRISAQDIDHITMKNQLPPHLAGHYTQKLYSAAGAPALFLRSSGQANLVLFKGGHDVVYNPGLVWLSEQRRRTAGARPPK